MVRAIYWMVCLLAAGCADADDRCRFEEDYVTRPDSVPGEYKALSWDEKTDPDSEEWVKIGHYELANGDTLSVTHKYCTIYNVDLVVESSEERSIKLVALLLRKALYDFSAVKPEFNQSLSDIIQESWVYYRKQDPDAGEIGLPDDAVTSGQSVEYSFSYSAGQGTKAGLYLSVDF